MWSTDNVGISFEFEVQVAPIAFGVGTTSPLRGGAEEEN